ncbi:MAG TPA: bacillithiol biosynthesis deacetylase BshB1 [Planctomycetota bacterium]|nr:bacillithiol biosynthesis deacetylase BshB1 [Planctomycetota bacterium]
MTGATDVLVLAPHPDDAEIACGGTILQLTRAGRRVVVVDFTRGEKGSRGDAATRAREAEAAAQVLGLAARENLGLPDTELRDDDAALRAVLGAIRRHRPALLLAPHGADPHPDHAAAHAISRRAWFHAGLRHVLPDCGPAFRPERVLWYPGNELVAPSVVVDIGSVVADKMRAIACYASQVEGSERAHFVHKLDPIERVELRDRYYGSRAGVRVGEAFVADGGVRLASATALVDGPLA